MFLDLTLTQNLRNQEGLDRRVNIADIMGNTLLFQFKEKLKILFILKI